WSSRSTRATQASASSPTSLLPATTSTWSPAAAARTARRALSRASSWRDSGPSAGRSRCLAEPKSLIRTMIQVLICLPPALADAREDRGAVLLEETLLVIAGRVEDQMVEAKLEVR